MQKMSFLNKLSLYMRAKTIYRSEDGYIEVRDSMENKRPVRVLYCDGIRETGIYLDEGMNTDPLFYYMQTLKEITLYYDDLIEQYENPIEHACDMQLGQVFVRNGWERPEGFCLSAWDTVSSFVMALAHGGKNFYDGWMKDPKSAMIS